VTFFAKFRPSETVLEGYKFLFYSLAFLSFLGTPSGWWSLTKFAMEEKLSYKMME
jgi:hypothetical protein